MIHGGEGYVAYTVENLVLKLAYDLGGVERYKRGKLTALGRLLREKSKKERVFLILENNDVRFAVFKLFRRLGFKNFALISSGGSYMKFKQHLLMRREIKKLYVARRHEYEVLRCYGDVVYIPDPEKVFILGE